MKVIAALAVFIGIIFSKNISAQNINHPTIQDVSVSYKAIPQSTTTSSTNSLATGSNNFQVIPQATVNLLASTNISKIYITILNSTTNAIIYQANYLINSPTVINNAGKKLFENANGSILLSNGAPIILKPYLFQITTEDSQQVMSPVFSSN